jgi:hypothetical protein
MTYYVISIEAVVLIRASLLGYPEANSYVYPWMEQVMASVH